jgi:UDP-N-acetylglucosamine--N-acetylmuramyl-(pentapeptide) pyrophosphoryl-undecaprenol N-acetylglucosamine transferase
MKAADFVVCRAGATTLSELAAAGKPAILVPFPAAADDHQRKNASVIARAGGAGVMDERDLTGERLADAIARLAGDSDRRRRMAAAIRNFARPDAASRIAAKAFELAGVK